MKEIGSEYWLEEKKIEQYKVPNDNKITYLLSGRTAIDYALELIMHNKKIKNVYFPSYCCESMIVPFEKRNVQVDFYTVKFENGNFIYDIDCEKECDIFFAMNYFGLSRYNMDYYIEQFKKRNICIIEDATHSILSKRKYNEKSDFVIASLRKWFPIISGGILINQSNKTVINSTKLENNYEYVNLKEEAMIEKRKYINSLDSNNKQKFLEVFKQTEEILSKDYKNYSIDEKSYSILKNLDLDEIIKKRQNNAKIIYKFLQNQNEIQYPINANLEEDVPLFVPVFIENNKREKLRKLLINNNVYCPNHWPIPKKISEEKQMEIYNKELSLICDQRYSTKNIEKYVNLIKHKEI